VLRKPRDVKPAPPSEPVGSLPAGRRSCSWPICAATWPWSHRAALLFAAYPVTRL
jgi:hypothetical protein